MASILLSALSSAGAFFVAHHLFTAHEAKETCQGTAAEMISRPNSDVVTDQQPEQGEHDDTGNRSPSAAHNGQVSVPSAAPQIAEAPPQHSLPPTSSPRTLQKLFTWRLVGFGVAGSTGIQLAVFGLRQLAERLSDRSRRSDSGGRRRAADEPGSPLLDSSSDRPSKRLPRVPLPEVVRFKERQWFLEELEASQEGDANAMLRLAKQYLHGQGCQKSLTAASDWLRKARSLGIHATLDELYAGDDLRREFAAEQAKRDQLPRKPISRNASSSTRSLKTRRQL